MQVQIQPSASSSALENLAGCRVKQGAVQTESEEEKEAQPDGFFFQTRAFFARDRGWRVRVPTAGGGV